MKLKIISNCLLTCTLSLTPLLAADVIATGLNNPRGIAFAPDGTLYVAEAGTGGSGPCITSPEGGSSCLGSTGSITRINLRTGTQERVVTGLPSLAGEGGGSAIGPADVSFQGGGFFTIGLGADPAERNTLGGIANNLAQLARLNPNGKSDLLANLGDFEEDHNPAGGPKDTDPFGMLALPGKQIVADAGGNDLLEISASGNIRTLAVFPNQMAPAPDFLGLPPGTEIPAEPVPTTVVLGQDGFYYVGQLTGFPFQPGSAKIYRVPVDGGSPVVAYSGFTNIIDIAFGPDGALYVLEISKNGLLSGNPEGALFKVLPDGTKTELAAGQLSMPGGIVVGDKGTLYVTNWSVKAGGGEVLLIEQ